MNKTKLEKSKESKNFFKYKGKPLVRCGNIIYYGDMSSEYVVKIESKTNKKILDLNVSDSLNVEMINTNSDINETKKIIKISEKKGLYPALDIASIWLERALAE